jgi:dynein heavy chain, axonemal
MNLQPIDTFMEKLVQTYEMMVVRHGFMLVGKPFGGKTSLLHLLAETLNLQNKLDQGEEKVEYETVNPKALTINQLYGYFDDVLHEWSNGVVANKFRYVFVFKFVCILLFFRCSKFKHIIYIFDL